MSALPLQAQLVIAWAADECRRARRAAIPMPAAHRDHLLSSASPTLMGYSASREARRAHQRQAFRKGLTRYRVRLQATALTVPASERVV